MSALGYHVRRGADLIVCGAIVALVVLYEVT